MASDLIYREDAKVFVRHACYKKINPIDYLDEVPAADVRPVVRGRWIPYRPDCRPVCDWKCSNCGYDPDLGTQPFFDFCPNCGAGMKEVNSGDTRTQG